MTTLHRDIHHTHKQTSSNGKMVTKSVSTHDSSCEKQPNAETIKSIRDAQNNTGITSCYSVEELFANLKAEDQD